LVTPCFALMLGAINCALIVAGRLQPFIATLAMMVSALGIGRLTAGQDYAVIPVYTGTNASQSFEILRSMVWGLIPMPSVFFLAAIIFFGAILRFTTFGRYVYAIGGNVEAAKLSGIKVAQVQFAAYVISGMLAGVAAVLFVAQYRQGKPDAGLELDAIAAVVIGVTSLIGGRGGHCHGNLFLLTITHPPTEATTCDSNRLALRSRRLERPLLASRDNARCNADERGGRKADANGSGPRLLVRHGQNERSIAQRRK
jgi:ribose/xylose/arabinose/galactoside ABC-type transport system permease subunit